MQYYIITYGCQMNKSDSERIALVLEKSGYKPTSKIESADLIVVNMCSVRQSAVDRIFGLGKKFKELKTINYKSRWHSHRGSSTKSGLKTILTGCILQNDRKKFAQVFDLILNIKDLPRLPKIIGIPSLQKSHDREISATMDYFKIKPKYSNGPCAFIPISNGCNNFCSYCVVPYTRGSLICRDHKEILKETKEAIKNGFKEIWLLGQNINDYRSGLTLISTRKNAEVNFAKLLKMVNDIPGNFQIRFISPNPINFSDELIDVIANSEKVAKFLHLPVQSGDNKILKKMNRPYTISQYKNLVKKIRKKIPGINLSTDVIVGFPGESKKQFENTVKLFKEMKFNLAFVAKYSPRPGTAAFKLKENVPWKEKKRREKVLIEILNPAPFKQRCRVKEKARS